MTDAAAAVVAGADAAAAVATVPKVGDLTSNWPDAMGVTNYDTPGCALCMPCCSCYRRNRYTTLSREKFDVRMVAKTCCGGWKEASFEDGLVGKGTTFEGGIKCCGLCDPYVEVEHDGKHSGKFMMYKPDCKICCCNFLRFGTGYNAAGQEIFSEYRHQCCSSCQLNMLECFCNMACMMCGIDCSIPECLKCQECRCKELCEPLCECGYVDKEYPLYRPATLPLPSGFYDDTSNMSVDEKARMEVAVRANGAGPGMPWATLVHRRHVKCPCFCPDYWGYKHWPAFSTDEERRVLMCAALGRKWKPMS